MTSSCAACGRPTPDLVLHHDHSARHGNARSELIYWFTRPQRQPRFAPTMVCRRCNSVDAVLRRKLRLPADFSLCAEEISLVAPPGRPINYRAARLLVAALRWRGVLPRGEEEQ